MQQQSQEESKRPIDRMEHSKLAVIGNVDSGKSTLVGVLTKGIYDDGRGSAREVHINNLRIKESF